MSSYGSSTGVTAPYLDEKKALENVLYVLQHVDKGELEELLRNEDQLNDIITDNEEVGWFFSTFFYPLHVIAGSKGSKGSLK